MRDFFSGHNSEKISNQFIRKFPGGIELWIKREDLLHPEVSGNKFRKLKYNLQEAINLGKEGILTFGGAHSNHISATAAAGKELGLETIGVIRGEELARNKQKWSPTLKFADSCGMKFHFISREEYRGKASEDFISHLKDRFGDFYLVPEGGTNPLAIKGCEEILTEIDTDFDFIAVSVGTGGTMSGLINATSAGQKVLGFPALKSDHFEAEIAKMTKKKKWKLVTDYNFGGYAKVDSELIGFMNDFRKNYGILLDPVYTGKLVFGIFELSKKGYFPEISRILAIHTGGLQGIEGMNKQLERKSMPKIQT